MISDKRLKTWRTMAILNRDTPDTSYNNVVNQASQIMELTQELMDIRLLNTAKTRLSREIKKGMKGVPDE